MSRYIQGKCTTCKQNVWLTASSAADTKCRRCELGLPPLEPPTCGICYEDMSAVRIRFGASSNHSWDNFRCSHLRGFCRDCLRSHAVSRLEEGSWNVRCPGERCSYVLIEQDLRLVLNKSEDRALLSRYEDLRNADHGGHLRAILCVLAEEYASTVSRDVADSESSVHPEAQMEHAHSVKDTSTGSRSHAPQSPSGFEHWAADCCQACPKCLVVVRKESGCNHMVCHCGTEFCFGCGAPYDRRLGPPCACSALKEVNGPKLAFWLRYNSKIEGLSWKLD